MSARTIGGNAVWPYAHWKLRSGRILFVAPGIKMGIININRDGTVPVVFYGTGDSGRATLTLDEPVTYQDVTVTMIESELTESPRWIRVLAETGADAQH
ncbi:MAG TPA: hypothetical protein VHC49_01055 [Mycobacteriales bacterium]|nr:hypothetical protein [Mycobacteriales bacterium]